MIETNKVSVTMNNLYMVMGGKSKTTLPMMGYVITGHINNRQWDEKDISIYCREAVLDFWNDISDRDFLSSEMSELEKVVKDLLQRCKEEASIA